MPDDLPRSLVIMQVAQVLYLLAGAVVLWRLRLSPAARAHQPERLPHWGITGFDFAFACFLVITGGLFGQTAFELMLRARAPGLDVDTRTVLIGAGFQAGLLTGIAVSWLRLRRLDRTATVASAPPPPSAVLGGLLTLLAAMPVLFVVHLLWTLGLERLGVTAERQPLVDLFARADSPWLVAGVVFLAVIVAPLIEEVVFRGGLFHFLRGRVPRAVALGLPAGLFGLLHANLLAFAPLVVLGVAFALAYERTGRIAVPIIAHALFNLNTLIFVLSGAADVPGS